MIERPEIPFTTKLFQTLSFLTIGLAMGLLLWFFYLLFFPFKAFDVSNQPVPTTAEKVTAGEEISFSVNYCKYLNYPDEIRVQLVNHVTYHLTTYEANFPVGCREVHFEPVVIPAETPAGSYYLSIDMATHLNIFRDIHYTFQTQTFAILDKPSDEVLQ